MRKVRVFSVASVVILLGCLPAAAQTAAAPTAQTAAANGRVATTLTVTVPQDNAELYVDGKLVIGEGTSRTVSTMPQKEGTSGKLELSVRWDPNTYTTMTRARELTYRAGDSLNVDLTREAPTDRVRVIYVPTPDDVAEAMVRLAGVSASDVAFEPGCGDARITIAAVKAGAKRGVGIDIDPERVTESRENVEKAGLSDRIEIRQGDALDIKDLSSATVVFLYMGDHFNMLIRPHLWRQLKVGARVVSHRFKMGDWEPDNTVTTNSAEGGEYELHLWTITEEVKRRLERGR